MNHEQIAVIGGGPAGLAAALAASEAGADEIVLIERDRELGGILNQCVHDGFGNLIFGCSLTGPEYAHRFVDQLPQHPPIKVLTDTMVLQLKQDRRLKAVNREGAFEMKPGAVILAMGCRERSRFQVMIPGYRPAGVYTAGAVQRLINMEGLMPGERVVILGSGDIGLIMARRLTLEGAKVLGVFEILPRPGGLTRNVVQCLHDFEIPLYLSHTVTFIHGKKKTPGGFGSPGRPPGKTAPGAGTLHPLRHPDSFRGPNPGKRAFAQRRHDHRPVYRGPRVDQDMATSVEGIFAGGNVVLVYDLVDEVTRAARIAGRAAAHYVSGVKRTAGHLILQPGKNVAALVPQQLSLPLKAGEKINLYLRVSSEIRDAVVTLLRQGKVIFQKKLRIVRPPEMVHLQIESSLFEDLHDGEEITCRVTAQEVNQN